MSVVHLDDRITTDSDLFYNNRTSVDSLVLFTGNAVDTFSVDFHMGDMWTSNPGEPETNGLYKVNAGEIVIPSNGSVLIETVESISMPNNIFGLIMPTGGLFLNRGIICSTAKIEPGYSDNLYLLLYNTTRIKQTVKFQEKVATAVFFLTEETPLNIPNKTREYPSGSPKSKFLLGLQRAFTRKYREDPYAVYVDLLKLLIVLLSGAVAARFLPNISFPW